MIKKILSILFVLLLLAVPGLGGRTLIGTYNQTYADPDNGGANIWTTFDSSNDMYVWANDESQQYFIVNTSTTASAYDTLFVLNNSDFGLQGALGDLSYSLDTNKTYILGPFETSRFKQSDGKIYIDLNSTRGKVICIGTM